MYKTFKANIRTASKKRREKPEDNIVKPQIKLLCLQFGIKIFEIQSSTYDPFNKRYMRQHHAPVGYPDLSGIGPNGECVMIELKAPGKRSTLKPHQRHFLVQAINHGAFAICTDSMTHFSSIWFKWKESKESMRSKPLLLEDLPPEPKRQTRKIPPQA